jgi:predicted adenylyl cyclase CyaB
MPNPINIECEIRAFVTDEQYDALSERLMRIAMSGGEDEQVTYYFTGNGDPDLRIQRNGTGAKIWMKKGAMHDEARHEIEVPCQGDDFPALEELFLALGYVVSVKWFRKRRLFKLDGITVTLDDTKGYGKIIELEKICMEDERDTSLGQLKTQMHELGIAPTPKEEFDLRLKNYKENWRALTGAS